MLDLLYTINNEADLRISYEGRNYNKSVKMPTFLFDKTLKNYKCIVREKKLKTCLIYYTIFEYWILCITYCFESLGFNYKINVVWNLENIKVESFWLRKMTGEMICVNLIFKHI